MINESCWVWSKKREFGHGRELGKLWYVCLIWYICELWKLKQLGWLVKLIGTRVWLTLVPFEKKKKKKNLLPRNLSLLISSSKWVKNLPTRKSSLLNSSSKRVFTRQELEFHMFKKKKIIYIYIYIHVRRLHQEEIEFGKLDFGLEPEFQK